MTVETPPPRLSRRHMPQGKGSTSRSIAFVMAASAMGTAVEWYEFDRSAVPAVILGICFGGEMPMGPLAAWLAELFPLRIRTTSRPAVRGRRSRTQGWGIRSWPR